MNINVNLDSTGIDPLEISQLSDVAKAAAAKLENQEMDFTGWVKDPLEITSEEVAKIKGLAEEIRSSTDVFLVLGVGGSYMGAKAVIDLFNGMCGDGPKVVFAGYNFSGRYLNEVMDSITGSHPGCCRSALRVSVCVISKSGTTTETMAAYAVVKEYMVNKYGPEEAGQRTYMITENVDNVLRRDGLAQGATILDIPLTTGGRYSVLTPVGLLPIAVAGIDIEQLLDGAKSVAEKFYTTPTMWDYAIARYLQHKKGKAIEVFAFFYPYLEFFGEWLKQLFGESEGKEGKGLFPAGLQFSRDLHSMGQFLQEGSPCFFETFITAKDYPGDMEIPLSGPEGLRGKTLNQINRCAELGVMAAHRGSQVPLISIEVESLDVNTVGQMIYFFQATCGLSALLLEVNPFDQPGVEAYKREMKAEIAKL